MGTGQIKISSIWYDEESRFYQYRLEISSSVCNPVVEFYGNPDHFQRLGNRLISFPADIHDAILFDANDHLGTLKLKIYCYDKAGSTAIHVQVDVPDEYVVSAYKCDFYIQASAASLNKLGGLLRNWNPAVDALIWFAET